MTIEALRRRRNTRILVVDDNPSIHHDFSRILARTADTSELDMMEESIFGARAEQATGGFEVTSAFRGEDALALVRKSHQDGAPFALAFLDVRMPNGWDGIETLTHLWQEDPAIQVVLCTAYSDYSLIDIAARFKAIDNLLVLTKPFEPMEVQQMAFALTEKWSQRADIEARIRRASVQYAASKALLEAESLSKGIVSVLGIVGAALGCQLGALWLLTQGTRTMRCQSVWKDPPGALTELDALLERTTRSPDEPSMRRVMEPGAPSFCEESLAEQSDARATTAVLAGMHTALQFPVRMGSVLIGAVEFFAPASVGMDEEQVAMMVEICSKIGTFLRSKQIESTLRESEAKNRALLRAIPDAIFLLGSDGECMDLKAESTGDPALAQQTERASSRHVTELFSAEMAEQMMAHAKKALDAEATQAFEHDEIMSGDRQSFEVRVLRSSRTEALIVMRDITERRRMEVEAAELRARDELFRAQAEVLAELSAPLIPLREDVVVMPLVGALDLRRAQRVLEVLVEGVAARKVQTTILDLTGVPSLTAESAGEFLRIAQAVRLLGSDLILSGVRPDVARSLVAMGVDLSGIVTHRTLETGVAFALRRGRGR